MDPLRSIDSSRDFAAEIRAEIDKGVSFVPFIGSGLSSTSGILMGENFTQFLAYTVYHCLATTGERKRIIQDYPEFSGNWQHEGRWDVRNDGWPKYPNPSEVKEASRWIYLKFSEISEDAGYVVLPEPTDKDPFPPINDITRGELAEPGATQKVSRGAENLASALNRPFAPSILRSENYAAPDTQTREFLRTISAENVVQDFIGRPGDSSTSQRYIVERGIRSLYEWRATLKYLSELRVEKPTRSTERLVLEDAESGVIDSFNIHITSGKKCNLGHLMLAHLARPLRSRMLLTTNFDDLIEEAFDQLLSPLEVFDLTTHGSLPTPETVRAQNCLIKLHGGKLDTRADFSLDDPPAEIDADNFARSLLGCRYPSDDSPRHNPSHLLVLGYSGRDNRCIQLIKYVLDICQDFKVYWVCYNEGDRRRINDVFGREGYNNQVVTIQTNRPDLLLYETYQNLTLSLPGGGFSYNFVNKVPPERVKSVREIDGSGSDSPACVERLLTSSISVERLRDSADTFSIKNPTRRLRLIYAGGVAVDGAEGEAAVDFSGGDRGRCVEADGRSGLGYDMTKVFKSMSDQGYQVIWLELQDFTNIKALHHEAFKVIALRLGYFQLEHFLFSSFGNSSEEKEGNSGSWLAGLNAHILRLVKYLGTEPSKWVLFLYGRGCAGGCSGWGNEPWSSDQEKCFHEYLRRLAQIGFKVVWLPYSNSRHACLRAREELIEEIADRQPVPRPLDGVKLNHEKYQAFVNRRKDGFGPLKLMLEKYRKDNRPILQENSERSTYYSAMKFVESEFIAPVHDTRKLGVEGYESEVKESFLRLHFLYALTLFRQSRHFSAFLCEGVFRSMERYGLFGVDNDESRAKLVRKWVQELEANQILYHKPGGYSWKYRDVRLGIQHLIESMVRPKDSDSGENPGRNFGLLPYEFLGQTRARTHFWIGDWYQKAFFATGHSMPLIESLYHRFQALEFAPFACPSRFEESDKMCLSVYRCNLVETSVLEIIKTLRLARPWIKFWLYGPEAPSMFDGDSSAMVGKAIDNAANQLGLGRSRKWHNRMLRYRKVLQNELCSLRHSVEGEAGNMTGKKVAIDLLPDTFSADQESVERKLAHLEKTFKLNHGVKVISSNDWQKNFKEHLKVLGFGNWDDALDLGCRKLEIKMRTVYGTDILWASDGVAHKIKELTADLEWRLILEKASALCPEVQDTNGRYRDDAKGGQARIRSVVKILGEYAYAHVKRAKLLSEAGMGGVRTKILWMKVCIICRCVTDICRNLDPFFLDFELDQRIRIQTIHGLALGHLERYTEGHRRLTEAFSMLSKRRPSQIGPEHAIIKLRRAEIYLLEERRLRKKIEILKFIRQDVAFTSNPLLGRALLDDAWNCLDSAERSLSGQSHSSLWWGRLVALRLRVYSQHEEHGPDGNTLQGTLAFRRRLQPEYYLDQLFDRGLLISPSARPRQLRCIRLYLVAYRKITGKVPPVSRVVEIQHKLDELRDSGLDGAVLHNFHRSVSAMVEGLLEEGDADTDLKKIFDKRQLSRRLGSDIARFWKNRKNGSWGWRRCNATVENIWKLLPDKVKQFFWKMSSLYGMESRLFFIRLLVEGVSEIVNEIEPSAFPESESGGKNSGQPMRGSSRAGKGTRSDRSKKVSR